MAIDEKNFTFFLLFSKSMSELMPESLKAEVLVRAKVEDPEKLKERQEILKNKSVHELSQIHSPAEFPVPETLKRLAKKRDKSKEPEQRPER